VQLIDAAWAACYWQTREFCPENQPEAPLLLMGAALWPLISPLGEAGGAWDGRGTIETRVWRG